MNTSITPKSVIKLTCEIRIRKIGDGIFLLPITNASVSSGSFYKITEIGELIVKKLYSVPASDGVIFEDLMAYISEYAIGVNRDILKADIASFIVQLSCYGFTEVI